MNNPFGSLHFGQLYTSFEERYQKIIEQLKFVNQKVTRISGTFPHLLNKSLDEKLKFHDYATNTLISIVEILSEFTKQLSVLSTDRSIENVINEIESEEEEKCLANFSFVHEDLSRYKNYVGECIVTNLYNPKYDLCFITIVNVGSTSMAILDLQHMKHLEAYREFPNPGEVFAIYDEGLFRAVRENTIKIDTKKIKVLLIDVGEILEYDTESFTCFKLEDKFKNISAQAILCHLEKINNSKNFNAENFVTENLYRKFDFNVIKQHSNKLDIELFLDNKNEIEPISPRSCITGFIQHEEKNHLLSSSNELQSNCDEEEYNPIKKYGPEMASLFEEPIQTSNALEAIMGYVPQDEKRICKFFDPITNGCFKKGHCKFEHVELMKDGWTRDKVPIYISVKAELTYPDIGMEIEVVPTHIVDVDYFYAHIKIYGENLDYIETLSDLNLLINKSEMVKNYKPVQDFVLYELVLAKYKDRKFYRARIIDINEEYVKIVFLDYGNSDTVHLNDLRAWVPRFGALPFQAVACRIYNITKLQNSNSDAIEQVKNIIFNRTLKAIVMNLDIDLVVKLIDMDGFDVGETLCEQKLAKFEPKSDIIFSNQSIFPG